MTGITLDATGEFKRSVWRIVTYTSHDLGGESTCGYLLSAAQVDEITTEAHEYAKGLAAAERERIRQLAKSADAQYPNASTAGGHLQPLTFLPFADLIGDPDAT